MCNEHMVPAKLMAKGVEELVGRFVHKHLAAKGCRAGLFLHTKLVPDAQDLAASRVIVAHAW